MVEPPEGSPSRRLPPARPPDGRSTRSSSPCASCGKRSVMLDSRHRRSPTGRGLEALLAASADVLIDSAEPGAHAAAGRPELEAEALAARHRHLVVAASVTAYGRTGPYAGRDVPGSVIDATSGMCWKAGLPEREPLMPPGNISVRHSRGRGRLRDRLCSNPAPAATAPASSSTSRPTRQPRRSPTGRYPTRPRRMVAGIELRQRYRAGPGPVYTILAAADGFVRLVVLSPRQWHAIRAWLGEPDYLQDPGGGGTTGFIGRFMIADAVLNPLYEELFSTMTMEDVAEEAQRQGNRRHPHSQARRRRSPTSTSRPEKPSTGCRCPPAA